MTPFYDLNQIAAIEVEEEDQDHSSIPPPTFFDTQQILQGSYTNHHFNHEVVIQQQQQLHHDQELIHRLTNQGSADETIYEITEQRSSLIDQQKSGKWMSSKTRIMKKMMNPRDEITNKKPRKNKQLISLQDHEQQQQRQKESVRACSSSSINSRSCTGDGFIRECSDCKTTKTPLWRGGPSGPKSLCNACGIRQRKARRALATAAAVSVGLIPSTMEDKVRKLDIDRTVPFKKRCRFSTGSTQKKIRNSEDIVVRLSRSKAFHRVFPQDEKDAAILLMALSCGLMCS